MEKNLELHYDFNDSTKDLTSKQIESVIPERFEFDNHRSNSIGGVNYVFVDVNEEDIIRISIRDTSLFSASFYAKSEEKGVSRARTFRDSKDFEMIADEVLTDIFG
jgi:hypothetical protein